MDFSNSIPYSSATAVGICALNTLVGYLVARTAFKKKMSTFVGIVIGSMIVRVAVLIATVFVFIAVLNFHRLAFSLAFVISSFVFLMVEIIVLHKTYESSKNLEAWNFEVEQ